MNKIIWEEEQVYLYLLLFVFLLSLQCDETENEQLQCTQITYPENKMYNQIYDYRKTVFNKKIRTRWRNAIFKDKLPEKSVVFIYDGISQSRKLGIQH